MGFVCSLQGSGVLSVLGSNCEAATVCVMQGQGKSVLKPEASEFKCSSGGNGTRGCWAVLIRKEP